MKLSTRARYGLQCMIAVSRLAAEARPVSLEEVARHTGLSKRYLEQLVIPLRHAHLLRSSSGRAGGYFLARAESQIRLGEIVEAMIGPINIVDCVCEPEHCFKADRCETRLIYLLINRSITSVLNEHSLADLSDRERLSEIVETLRGEIDGHPGVNLIASDDLCGCSVGRTSGE